MLEKVGSGDPNRRGSEAAETKPETETTSRAASEPNYSIQGLVLAAQAGVLLVWAASIAGEEIATESGLSAGPNVSETAEHSPGYPRGLQCGPSDQTGSLAEGAARRFSVVW